MAVGERRTGLLVLLSVTSAAPHRDVTNNHAFQFWYAGRGRGDEPCIKLEGNQEKWSRTAPTWRSFHVIRLSVLPGCRRLSSHTCCHTLPYDIVGLRRERPRGSACLARSGPSLPSCSISPICRNSFASWSGWARR